MLSYPNCELYLGEDEHKQKHRDSYSDVLNDYASESQIMDIVEEYKSYKTNYSKKIYFNPSNEETLSIYNCPFLFLINVFSRKQGRGANASILHIL